MATGDAIDFKKLPPVLPANVARTNKDGSPTKALLDWEFFQSAWYKNTVVNLNTRLTEVRSDTDGNSAAITQEINARTDGDNALAEMITTVAATVDDATANGQIYFAAKAGPSGSAAAYGLYLTAGGTFTGFEAVAMSDGTSAIGMRASRFVFTDSGTGESIFDYFGGQFVLTGNVAVSGNLLVGGSIGIGKLGSGSVQTANVVDNAITNVATGEGGWQGATASISCRAGDRILVDVTYSPDGQVVSTGPTTTIYQCFVRLNGSTSGQKSVRVFKYLAYVSLAGDGSVTGQVHFWMTTSRSFVFIAPSTGTHTITATACGGAGESECFLRVMAVSK